MSKVSVIVPVYNCEAYIDQCLESLMNQTHQDLEALLMVGFCRDNSLEKCLNWQKQDERIIVVSRKDSSLGDARNYALRIAAGEYIAYLDADDSYSTDYIEAMLAPLEADKSIDVSCCGYDRIDGERILKGVVPDQNGIADLNFRGYLTHVPAAAVWLKMFRKQWLLDNQIEMFDGCCEDQSLHFIIAALVKKVYFIRKPLYHYNIGNENSLVRTMKSLLDYSSALEYTITYLKKQNLYDRNRGDFICPICSMYKFFLQRTNYNEELVTVCRSFLEEYFPEAVEDYETSKKRNMQISGKVILYGAGADAERFLQNKGAKGISYIVDRNPALHGKRKYGLLINPVEALYEDSEEVTVIIASSWYYYEISSELRAHNLFNIYTPEEFSDMVR